MASLTNNLIVSISGFSLVLLIGSGIKKPELFENQGYSSLASLLAGGLLGAVTSQNPAKNVEGDDYRIK